MIQVKGPGGRAAPRAPQPSLADSESLREAAAAATVSPSLDSTGKSVLQPT